MKLDPGDGSLVEVDNRCPDLQSLQQLTDIDKVLEMFGDDVLFHAAASQHRRTTAASDAPDAGAMGARKNWKTGDAALTSYALATTQRLIEKACAFAQTKQKKILFVLSYSSPTVATAVKTGERFDASLVDWLRSAGVPHVDLLEAHAKDFADFSCSVEAYLERYYIGHYNTAGNLFCAFAIREALLGMLRNPPPVGVATGNQRASISHSHHLLSSPYWKDGGARKQMGAWYHNLEYDAEHHLVLDAYVPPGNGPFPVVILVHGGGFVRGSKISYLDPLFAPLSAAGYAWFSVEYRMAGSGDPPVRCEELVRDVETAIRWVKNHATEYKLDMSRAALCGESAGGHLVSLCGARMAQAAADTRHSGTTTSLSAVVSFYGPHDLLAAVRSRAGVLGEGLEAMVGTHGSSQEINARLSAASPSSQIVASMVPYLLIHGTADEQVDYNQSVDFMEAMQALDNDVELVTLPGARHGMGAWGGLEEQYIPQLLEWLARKLT